MRTLSKGSVVDIIAPSYPTNEQEISSVSEYIKSIGLIPRIPDDLMGEDLFCSNTDEKRFSHLKNALYANDSKAIWCLKGGYGSARLIPMLNELKPIKQTKLFIGFSDITALHIVLTQKWGWKTIHAPMLTRFVDGSIDQISIDKLNRLLFGVDTEQKFELKLVNDVRKNITSTVTGGNLTIVQNSIGTDWQLNTNGKILLLEEVDETPYRIDRKLLHLFQAGIIDGAEAILFGDFNGDDLDQNMVDAVLKRFAANLGIPVFRIRGVGHTEINNPVPLNQIAVIEKNNLNI